jgi:hypothetical protein
VRRDIRMGQYESLRVGGPTSTTSTAALPHTGQTDPDSSIVECGYDPHTTMLPMPAGQCGTQQCGPRSGASRRFVPFARFRPSCTPLCFICQEIKRALVYELVRAVDLSVDFRGGSTLGMHV